MAEDNAITQTLIVKLPARRRCQADLVCTGNQAVEAVQRKSHQLVLMDMQLPEMDGIIATKTIRRLGGPQRAVPIVALTAYALGGQGTARLAAGMTGFPTKPVQADAISRHPALGEINQARPGSSTRRRHGR